MSSIAGAGRPWRVGGRAVWFAWRGLVRQPARAGLAVLGVAAIGALLFDMLMLSQGLVTSMRDLLDRTGWDIRVTASDDTPGRGPRVIGVAGTVSAIAALPQVRAAVAARMVSANVILERSSPYTTLQGITLGTRPPWTLQRGRDVAHDEEAVVSERVSTELRIDVGDRLTLQASCLDGRESLPPITFQVVGVAEFPLAAGWENTVATTLDGVVRACGGYGRDEADLILAASTGDPRAAARAIAGVLPRLRAMR